MPSAMPSCIGLSCRFFNLFVGFNSQTICTLTDNLLYLVNTQTDLV